MDLINPTPEELAFAIAEVKRKSRYTMFGIIVVVVLGLLTVLGFILAHNDAIAGQIVGVLIPTIAAMLAYRKSTENAASIHQVNLNVDGRLSQLITATERAARAEGHAEGEADRKVRMTDLKSNGDA